MVKAVSRQRRVLGSVLLYMAVVMVSAAAIWLLSADARREVDALATANADSTQWSLAQSEVEFLAFSNAARAVVAGQAQPAEARRRFDVFYSRVQTLKSAPTFAEVRALPEVEVALSDIDNFFAAAIPVVDADDETFAAALPSLIDWFPLLQADLRTISLAGVSVFSARSEAQRAAVSGVLTDLGLISFGLLALLLALVGILLTINRASQRQTSEIALTQGRLQAIISTSLDAILVAGKDGRVLDFNGAAEGIFGYTRDEAIGEDMADLIIPDHLRDAHNAGMVRYRQTGVKHVVGSGLLKLEAKRKDSSVFPVELSINSAESEEGEIFVSYIRDISKRVASENELVEARDKALAGEKAKADLLAVMSHEMRTPLNGVLGTLDLLSDTDLDERQQKYVGVMDASGKMLLEHVNNVLDISRVDAGKAERTEEPFDVSELAQSTVEGLQTTAALRGNTLKIARLGPSAGLRVGDRKRVQQILFNLLGNAIKFTENGAVTLEIDCERGGETVEFRVIDTGIGIVEADLTRIFGDFVTLDTSYQREVEGTGLGLGIVRRLTELLQGEIGVESEEGAGSVFWVRLPLPHVTDRPITRPVSQT
ncbi:MAG: PAS domain S-box protein, partial [Alphaproteobacteria bacterium]|nr:PAS domain S-box protein [Alphaproteobacteria bacterium]